MAQRERLRPRVGRGTVDLALRVGGAGIVGRIEIAPKPWLEDTFWNDFWGDAGATTVAARDSFDRELEIIMRESG